MKRKLTNEQKGYFELYSKLANIALCFDGYHLFDCAEYVRLSMDHLWEHLTDEQKAKVDPKDRFRSYHAV